LAWPRGSRITAFRLRGSGSFRRASMKRTISSWWGAGTWRKAYSP
jgi:hypothetical protein